MHGLLTIYLKSFMKTHNPINADLAKNSPGWLSKLLVKDKAHENIHRKTLSICH
jgi:hypothetical protein